MRFGFLIGAACAFGHIVFFQSAQSAEVLTYDSFNVHPHCRPSFLPRQASEMVFEQSSTPLSLFMDRDHSDSADAGRQVSNV